MTEPMSPSHVIWLWFAVCAALIPRGSSAFEIAIGSAKIEAGRAGTIAVTVSRVREDIYFLDGSITYEATAPIAASDSGTPECRLTGGSFLPGGFRFVPLGCEPVAGCDGVFVIASTRNSMPPDGATLCECTVAVPSSTARGRYSLRCSDSPAFRAFDEFENRLDLTCVDGSIEVVPCIGDCNGDGAVSVDELVMGVTIALEESRVETCHAFDFSGDGAVTIDEILGGIGRALAGCAEVAPDR